MASHASEGVIPFPEALVAFCDETIVAATKRAERAFTPRELREQGYPNLGGASPTVERPRHVESDFMRREYRAIQAAWDDLKFDLRRRIERGEVHLSGVLVGPASGEARVQILRALCATWLLDFVAGTVRAGGKLFTLIGLSREPIPAPTKVIADAPDVLSTTTPRLGMDDISKLSDHAVADLLARYASHRGWPGLETFVASELGNLNSEQVASLLERHADDVVRQTGISILPPGKVSPIPLIVRKMQERAAGGGLLSSLSDEADWLERWAAQKAPSYQSVGAKTIINRTNRIYADLKRDGAAADK